MLAMIGGAMAPQFVMPAWNCSLADAALPLAANLSADVLGLFAGQLRLRRICGPAAEARPRPGARVSAERMG